MEIGARMFSWDSEGIVTTFLKVAFDSVCSKIFCYTGFSTQSQFIAGSARAASHGCNGVQVISVRGVGGVDPANDCVCPRVVLRIEIRSSKTDCRKRAEDVGMMSFFIVKERRWR